MADEVEEALLKYLLDNGEIPDSGQYAESVGVKHSVLDGLIKSLSASLIVDPQDIKRERWVLTAEGQIYKDSGSPEVQVFLAIPKEGIAPAELQKKVEPEIFKIGRSQAMKNKWIEMGKLLVSRKVPSVEDRVKDMLVQIDEGKDLDKKDIDDLKRRKLISLETWRGYSLQKGSNFSLQRKKVATDLTREQMQSADWKDMTFKEYNFAAKGKTIECGHLHPLLKVREQFRKIFFEMGFQEMPTNNFVESSFWNFDALFQPQQHPARDSHDTFFLTAPSKTTKLPDDYVEKVKQVHERGGYGSRGYEYDWIKEEAEKNVLRTHTTAVSSRMLYKLAQEKPFTPKRYFSIDRVFRNEAVDKTHLAEFHQIEGLICDRGLTLGDLIGVLNDFFARLGMKDIRFKPAYNPYTEPSMEIFSFHEGLNKLVEIGNSGMFRPEMLLPMGLPEDVAVIAWGLSLERPTMILYDYKNIRDLFGHKVDLSRIKTNPICRLGMV